MWTQRTLYLVIQVKLGYSWKNRCPFLEGSLTVHGQKGGYFLFVCLFTLFSTLFNDK